MTELWKGIPGAPGYQVSSLGRVLGKTGLILKPHADHKGYLRFQLFVGGRMKGFKAHRLVAEAFIPLVDGKPQVNHKDFDKTNNRDSNLEWCSREENFAHAKSGGRFSRNGGRRFRGTSPLSEGDAPC